MERQSEAPFFTKHIPLFRPAGRRLCRRSNSLQANLVGKKCRDARTARSSRRTTLRVPSRTRLLLPASLYRLRTCRRRSNRRGRKLAVLRHTAFCFLFVLRRSVMRKSQWHPFLSFRRSPHCGRMDVRRIILRREGSAPTDAVKKSGVSSLLTRRASQTLTGEKRGVCERSELASACQGREAQSSRRPR